jgi:AraC family transcriptional regulator of adaptative response / DNA-3-methyladenine glycosylase II
MLQRVFARDRECDGRFLTGVTTTGIYCLPSCSARKPKPENVRFFATRDEARAAGLRACRRCRPDQFYRQHDPDRERLTQLLDRVRRQPSDYPDVARLAATGRFGVTWLNHLFRLHLHTTPAAFLRRARVEAAQRILLDTDRPLIDAAFEAGFEGGSVFYENFRRLTGLSPRAWRRLRRQSRFTLEVPADFRADECLRYLGRDPDSPAERVDRRTVRRAVRIDGKPAVLSVELRRTRATVVVEGSRSISPSGMARVHRIVRRLLGLDLDPAPFTRRTRRLGRLARFVARRPGLRIPQTADVFEGLVWSIIGQQINLPFALRLRRRLIERAGTPIDGLVVHPEPAAVARLDYRDLTAAQYSGRKAEYLIDTSRLVAGGDLAPESFPDDPATAVEQRLLAVRGLGPWSAQYVMMRACGFADCVPVGDSGLATALERLHELDRRPGPDETRRLMEPFAPYRSLATFHLWRMLGDPA